MSASEQWVERVREDLDRHGHDLDWLQSFKVAVLEQLREDGAADRDVDISAIAGVLLIIDCAIISWAGSR